MFVNIYFGAMDNHLNDARLLRNILNTIETGQASLTLWPEMQGQKNCFSFEVPGMDQHKVHADAIRQVQAWIRDFPTRGLPFSRASVF